MSEPTTNLHRWNRWYASLSLDEPGPYADTQTYQLGAEWVKDCALIEDWGCGKGWLTKFIPPQHYRGIDGSNTPFAAEVVDLTTYRSQVPGIFMRHVLEHNFEWRLILANALASFQERMSLIFFTPFGNEEDLLWEEDPGVPNLALPRPEIESMFRANEVSWTCERLETSSQFGEETIFYLEKSC